mmetsp:Transcript_22421/g.68321  ORF Transcript_22421/g.68321 Transcript_22421/m.68321 type:complete len:106 (+) Transcript_22421:384-701(+)
MMMAAVIDTAFRHQAIRKPCPVESSRRGRVGHVRSLVVSGRCTVQNAEVHHGFPDDSFMNGGISTTDGGYLEVTTEIGPDIFVASVRVPIALLSACRSCRFPNRK